MLKFKDFTKYQYSINEMGGWATEKTQETVITPEVIKEVVEITEKLSKEFNGHLKELNLPSLYFLSPVGSGTWWEDDLKNNPEKTYGDVDFMVAYPTLTLTDKGERSDEIATVKMYNKELLMWLDSEKFPNVDLEESRKMSTDSSIKLLYEIKLKSGRPAFIQVDFIVTHKEYSKWALFRMTPMKNVKGFVIGKLYTALGDALDLSIQVRGVRAKFDGDIMKPYSIRKNVEDRELTSNPDTFVLDIAKFFWEQSKTDKPFQNLPIHKWRGMGSVPNFEKFCEAIILLGETLSQLGEFGATIKYKNNREFLQSVYSNYEKGMMIAYNSPKFKKAKSKNAIEMMNKTRNLIKKYLSQSKKILNA